MNNLFLGNNTFLFSTVKTDCFKQGNEVEWDAANEC